MLDTLFLGRFAQQPADDQTGPRSDSRQSRRDIPARQGIGRLDREISSWKARYGFEKTGFTDTAIVTGLQRGLSSERREAASVVALLAEFDRRRLHLALGFSSAFEYCVRVLQLSEHETYNRIEAARASRKFPELLERLSSGKLSLTAIRLLAPHLTAQNFDRLTREAEGQRVEGIKLIIAKLKPQPPAPSIVRKLPVRTDVKSTPTPDDTPPASFAEVFSTPVPPPSRRAIVAPLSEAHYKLQVTISAAARERLGQIQDLMRHRLPSGDPAAIVEHALEVLHAELLKKKAAEVARPRSARESVQAKGRHIPAPVKRAVWRRDQGRCAFVGDTGRRCGAAGALEFHHVDPYAHGGKATVANIEMRCRAHNGFEWGRDVETREAAGIAAPAT
ncbi:MAG TPA: HNH endonuclease signature motif containing protein [Vicinamibacterales bacterium]